MQVAMQKLEENGEKLLLISRALSSPRRLSRAREHGRTSASLIVPASLSFVECSVLIAALADSAISFEHIARVMNLMKHNQVEKRRQSFGLNASSWIVR